MVEHIDLTFKSQLRHKFLPIIYRVLKNYVYNASGMIEEVKINMFFI